MRRLAWGRRPWSAFSPPRARKQRCAQQPNAGRQARLKARATQERRLEAVACRVEPVVTHPAPPQTRTGAMHAYGSSGRAAAALMQSPGVPWSGLVRSQSLPCLRPADALPDGAFPPVGRLGLTSPLPSVLCAAPTATSPSRRAALVARRSDTWCASVRSGCPRRARSPGGSPRARQGFCSPGPPFRGWHKETGGAPTFPRSPSEDMPRSQTPVVAWALAIPHPGRLPSGACQPSAFLSVRPGALASCPRLDTCRGSITRPVSSLHPAAYGPLRGGTRVRY